LYALDEARDVRGRLTRSGDGGAEFARFCFWLDFAVLGADVDLVFGWAGALIVVIFRYSAIKIMIDIPFLALDLLVDTSSVSPTDKIRINC
jgi:hypothetical protein